MVSQHDGWLHRVLVLSIARKMHRFISNLATSASPRPGRSSDIANPTRQHPESGESDDGSGGCFSPYGAARSLRRQRTSRWGVIGATALLAVASASCEPDSNPTIVESESGFRWPIGRNQVDILFVVDNSDSMCEEQLALRESLVEFIDPLVLQQADLQIAVVTTDMDLPAQSGRFQNRAAVRRDTNCGAEVDIGHCPSPDNGGEYPPLILRSRDPRYWDDEGDVDPAKLRRDLTCSVTVGTLGSERPMGLEAARVAVSEPLRDGYNSGFLRERAFLIVVFVSNSDDCSQPSRSSRVPCAEQNLVAVQDYVEFFAALKPTGPDGFIPLGIVGPRNEVACRSALGEAAPAPRYRTFIEGFAYGASTSVCEPPFEAPVEFGWGGQSTWDICLQHPLTCDSDSDCHGQDRCELRGGSGRGSCSSFRVQLDIERARSAPPLRDRECRIVRPTEEAYETSGDTVLLCSLVEGDDYVIEYDSISCSSGVIVSLSYRPKFLDQAVLLRYPRHPDAADEKSW
jgi:hypothetical protein